MSTSSYEGEKRASPIFYLALNERASSSCSRIPKKIERYYLNNDCQGVYFTRQEARCMAYFLSGLTHAQTAKRMRLAIATISQYCVFMQRKLGCYSKSELIGKVKNTEFLLTNPF